MELRHLRYFIRAAELLNFTKAAESLYVSQPTLSVQIHQLEEELGSELFARVGRNVHLTEAGKKFLDRALRAVRELEEGGKEIDAMNGLLRGTLCVGSLPLYGSKLVSCWIAEFNALYPDVYVRVKAGPSEDIEAGIIAGIIDVGFSFVPPLHSELNWKELLQEEIVVVVSKDHELATKRSIKMSDFRDLPIVLPSERISAMRLLTRYFEEHKVEPKVSMSFDDGHALIELVKKGKFVTCLPLLVVKGDPDICTLSLPEPTVRVATGALFTQLSPAARVFLDLISKACAAAASVTPLASS
jgi:LysR family cyn operon transcriptional activator